MPTPILTSERDPTTAATRSFRRPSNGELARLGVIAIAYVVAAKVSLLFALVAHNVSPIWPPSGIAVAALLLFGRRVWPAVFIAALIVNVPISETWWAALGTAVGNTLAPRG